jgi:hypothetical protein
LLSTRLTATIDGQDLPVGIIGNRPHTIEEAQSFLFHDFRYTGVDSNDDPVLSTGHPCI